MEINPPLSGGKNSAYEIKVERRDARLLQRAGKCVEGLLNQAADNQATRCKEAARLRKHYDDWKDWGCEVEAKFAESDEVEGTDTYVVSCHLAEFCMGTAANKVRSEVTSAASAGLTSIQQQLNRVTRDVPSLAPAPPIVPQESFERVDLAS